MRTIIQLPEDCIEALANFCRREKISRAEAIRRAISFFLKEQSGDNSDDAFGLWKNKATVDALELENKLRSEWSER